VTRVHSVPSGGKTPRYFAIDPSGKFLLAGNQESDNIVVFRISQKTGKLLKVGAPASVISPVSFTFLEAK
jgi:6-phosphogluconolactonase